MDKGCIQSHGLNLASPTLGGHGRRLSRRRPHARSQVAGGATMAGLSPQATDSNRDTENGRTLGRVSRRRHVEGGLRQPPMEPGGRGGQRESMSGWVGE